MRQKDFNLLDDEKIIWICVEPIVQAVRGKHPQIKSQVIMQLNNGQRALFFFQVLYGHANHGISQFFHQISYLMDTVDIWSALKSGVKYFGDIEMLGLIEKMENAYYTEAKESGNTVFFEELDRLYKEMIPSTVKLVGSFIRNHPAEFIQFQD